MSSISLFDVLMLGIGVYVLIGGIRGKGRLYSTGNVKKGMEEKYQKTMRLIYTILGVLMTLNGAVSCLSSYFYSYGEITAATETTEAVFGWTQKHDLGSFDFLTPQVFSVLSLVFLALCMTGIIVMLVVSKKMTVKGAQYGAAQQSSASDFDEQNETEKK